MKTQPKNEESALPQGDGVAGAWQPIATAPKDARWLRVKMADGSERRAHYAEGDGENQPSFRGWFVEVEVGSGKGNYFSEIDTPTHWMPEQPSTSDVLAHPERDKSLALETETSESSSSSSPDTTELPEKITAGPCSKCGAMVVGLNACPHCGNGWVGTRVEYTRTPSQVESAAAWRPIEVEAALNELREIFPDQTGEIAFLTNKEAAKVQISAWTRSMIPERDYWYGATLDEAMQKVREWKQSKQE